MTDGPATLAGIVAMTIGGLDGVKQTESGGAVTFAIGSRLFAVLETGALEVRLSSAIAGAALRTPDTGPSGRGQEWVRFAPAELDRFAIDRVVAWLQAARRHASD